MRPVSMYELFENQQYSYISLVLFVCPCWHCLSLSSLSSLILCFCVLCLSDLNCFTIESFGMCSLLLRLCLYLNANIKLEIFIKETNTCIRKSFLVRFLLMS